MPKVNAVWASFSFLHDDNFLRSYYIRPRDEQNNFKPALASHISGTNSALHWSLVNMSDEEAVVIKTGFVSKCGKFGVALRL